MLIPRRAAGSLTPTNAAPAGFTSRIVPRRSIRNIASAATSNSWRNRASDRRTSCSVRFRSVMSRVIVEPPIRRPAPSRRGDTAKETTIFRPSFRSRTVSKGSSFSPFRRRAMIRSNSFRRSSGTSISTDWPTASDALYPYMRSAPAFHVRISPVRDFPKIASSELWTIAASRAWASRAPTNSVMSTSVVMIVGWSLKSRYSIDMSARRTWPAFVRIWTSASRIEPRSLSRSPSTRRCC